MKKSNNEENNNIKISPKCVKKNKLNNYLKKQIEIKGSLYDNHPELMNEWLYEKNDKNPKELLSGSEYKSWWKCSKCKHEWKAMVASRTKNGTGCPVCNSKIVVAGINDIETLYPDLMKEWDYDKNKKIGLDPKKLIKRSEKKAWWICPICNTSYMTTIKTRTLGTGCVKCANEIRTSFQEQAIYYYLKKEFKDTQNRWNYIGVEADIFIPCLSLGIEYDGSYYHNNEESNSREKEKYEYLKKAGIKLIRIREKGLESKSHADYSFYIEKKNNDKDIEKIIQNIFDVIEIVYNYGTNIDIDLKRDRQEIYKQYIVQKKENSLPNLYPDLMKEWDYEKNTITPQSVVPGSEKKVWWKCNKDHSYEQQIASHVKGQKCPYCTHKKPIIGETDLETKYPEIAREWDYNKNKIKPNEVMAGSSKKVWWVCPKGHSYTATIYHRTGSKKELCPICCNKKILIGYNDLKSLKPELIKEWDYTKNTKKPEEYTCGSQQKVWWICPKCHNSYESIIRTRANLNTACPICNGKKVVEGFNDFYSKQPELLKEWNYEKNNRIGIYPRNIHMNSHKKVWWKCNTCSYEWMASPGKRREGTGCIKCGNIRSGLKRRKTK